MMLNRLVILCLLLCGSLAFALPTRSGGDQSSSGSSLYSRGRRPPKAPKDNDENVAEACHTFADDFCRLYDHLIPKFPELPPNPCTSDSRFAMCYSPNANQTTCSKWATAWCVASTSNIEMRLNCLHESYAKCIPRK